MRQIQILASSLLVAGIVSAQSPPEHEACSRQFAELLQKFNQLQMEVVELRLRVHERNVLRLEADLIRVVAERTAAEQEQQSNRDEALGAERQLARTDIAEDERAELSRLRDTFATDAHAVAVERQNIARSREAAVRGQIAAELRSIEQLTARLKDPGRK
jgi:hypothetical protein